MDREQEDMQFLGFLGIVKESIKIIFTWRKIFNQITLAFILPLSFIFLAHLQVSDFLFAKIDRDEQVLDGTKVHTAKHDKFAGLVKTDLTELWVFRVVYFVVYLIFSLLSTAAVTYTIACVYTAKSIAFNEVMSVVPKVWKRLMITLLWTFLTVFAYSIVFIAIFFIAAVVLAVALVASGQILLWILLVLYLVGAVYISAIWGLASVVSVLEESHGFRAMIKSKNLIKGKTGVSVAIFAWLTIGYLVVQVAFNFYVADGRGLGFLPRIGIAVLCLLVLFKLTLFNLVVQTVIYFVCKSYHHENIDKSALADHLEVYLLAEYVPLKAKDIQLEVVDV